MPYTNRFFFFILFIALLCAAGWFVVTYFLIPFLKRARGKIDVEHDFESKVADIEVEKLKQDKQQELKKVRQRILKGKTK